MNYIHSGEAAKVDRDFKSSIMHVALTKITRNGHWSKQYFNCILHVVFSAMRYIFFLVSESWQSPSVLKTYE